MFCGDCGTKIEEGGQFCQNCGRKIGDISIIPKNAAKPTPDQTVPVSGVAEFYGKDWQRKKVFAIASLPYFDVMIDKKYLYIIQMPKYMGATLGLLFGGLILNLLGSSDDNKRRKRYRSTWINTDHQIISNDYVRNIFLKVPLENLKGNFMFSKNKFTLKCGEKTIVLKKGRKELELFRQIIEKYVL